MFALRQQFLRYRRSLAAGQGQPQPLRVAHRIEQAGTGVKTVVVDISPVASFNRLAVVAQTQLQSTGTDGGFLYEVDTGGDSIGRLDKRFQSFGAEVAAIVLQAES